MSTISKAQLQEVTQEIDQMSRSQARTALRLIFESVDDNPDLFNDYHRYIEWAFQLSR